MKKIPKCQKDKLVAGAKTKNLPLFGKIMAISMLGESINGIMNLINQGIYYNKTGNYKNQPNHYFNSAPRFYYKLAPYASGSSLNLSSPMFW